MSKKQKNRQRKKWRTREMSEKETEELASDFHKNRSRFARIIISGINESHKEE